MVLPDAFGLGLAAIELGRGIHGEAHDVLNEKPEGGNDAQVAVHRLEVGTVAANLVVLDRDNADGEDEESEQVETGVDLLADLLLLSAVGRLEDENRLHEDEHSERLGERVDREQDQRAVEEDGGPYRGDEQQACALGDDAGP